MSTIEKAVEKLDKSTESQSKPSEGKGVGLDTTVPVDSTPAAGNAGTPTSRVPSTRSTIETVQATGAKQHEHIQSPAPEAIVKDDRLTIEIPIESLSDRGMLTPLTPRSHLAEEYRAIKRPLLRNISGASGAQIDHPNLIMVTSALQGDGKTFTAVNLAMSIAMEQDSTVLFIDADVAKASAGTLLGAPLNHPGLIDVLENKGTKLNDVILPTNIDNLRIMPAGVLHERSTEILAGQRMLDLMLEMSARYSDRVIVFDSPPLLMTSEASVLASFMGQIVFVASTDETPSEAVTEALEHVGEDKVVGMVLNKAHIRRSKFMGLSYGYGYGYGSGYGYEDGGRGAKPEAVE